VCEEFQIDSLKVASKAYIHNFNYLIFKNTYHIHLLQAIRSSFIFWLIAFLIAGF
jgi:hypothetical protein